MRGTSDRLPTNHSLPFVVSCASVENGVALGQRELLCIRKIKYGVRQEKYGVRQEKYGRSSKLTHNSPCRHRNSAAEWPAKLSLTQSCLTPSGFFGHARSCWACWHRPARFMQRQRRRRSPFQSRSPPHVSSTAPPLSTSAARAC